MTVRKKVLTSAAEPRKMAIPTELEHVARVMRKFNPNPEGESEMNQAAAELAEATAPKGPRKVVKKSAKKVTKKAAPAKAKAKAAPDPNMVTLAELCKAAKVEPMTARRYLRNSSIEMGTDARWTWKKGSKAVTDVKKLLADIGK